MIDSNGAQGRNRTTDTAIFSRMLYQLSYLGAAGAASSGEAAVIEERHSHCLEHDPQNLQTFRARSRVKSKRYVEPSFPFKTISRERRLKGAVEAVNRDRNRARGSRLSTWDLGGPKRRFSCLAYDRGARSAATAAIPLCSGASGVRARPKVSAPKGIHKLRFALLVNGQEYPLATDPRMTLLDALHEEPISNRSK